jgi:site-specific DNA recombinase
MANKVASDKRVVAYVRVSTKDQDDRYTITAQLEKCQAYAEKNGLNIIKKFREARSGYKADARIEFYKMLEFIRTEKIPGVVFAWRDRMQRNPEDYVLLKATGVTLHDIEGGQSFNPNNPDDYEATAAYEHDVVDAKKFSARLSKRVRESYDGLVDKGHWPHSLPLGYNRETVDAKQRIVIDPIRGPLIQQMFRLFASGVYSRKAIFAKMRDLGLRSRKGKIISRTQIETYLKNPFYAGGQFRWKGQLYNSSGEWPPLISKALFNEVQAVFEAKQTAHRRGPDYKYRGLFTCGLCGCAYIQEDKARHYYRCTYQRQACNKLGSPRLKESELDLLLESAIDMLTLDPMTYDWFKGQVDEAHRLSRETEAVEKKRLADRLNQLEEEWARTWDGFKRGIMPDEGFIKEEFAKLSDEKTRIQTRLRELDAKEEEIVQNSLEVLGILNNFKNQYFSASPEKRRRMNFLLFRKITVRPLQQPKKELLADPKRFLVHLQYPLQIEWKEPFDFLFDLRFQRELTNAGNEFFWKEYPEGGWGPALRLAQEQKERA